MIELNPNQLSQAKKGALHWTYQPLGGSGGITAATSDGGVNIYDAGNNIIQLDAHGNAGTPVPCPNCAWPRAFGSWTALTGSPGLYNASTVNMAAVWPMLQGSRSWNNASPKLTIVTFIPTIPAD